MKTQEPVVPERKASIAPLIAAVGPDWTPDAIAATAGEVVRTVGQTIALNLTKKRRGLEFKRLQTEVATGLGSDPPPNQLALCLQVPCVFALLCVSISCIQACASCRCVQSLVSVSFLW